METFEVDDSEQGLLRPTSNGRQFRPIPPPSSSSALITRPLRTIVAILALPFRLLSSLIRFLFRVLRIPLPQFSPFTLSSLTNTYRPLGPRDGKPQDARSVAERWVRALEEQTGAVCIGRGIHGKRGAANGHSVASGADVGAGPSTLTARSGAWNGDVDADVKLLPDFFLGGYEDFVRTCEREVKVGCIVLVSEEHDDVAEFERSTLTDPALVRLIQDNDILVWGGDIRDREGWSTSQKLQATTYPFVAFIALQPRRAPTTGGSPSPTLTILSRHQGPAIPSATAPTSAPTLVAHLSEQLLPRVTPFLARVRTQAAERERTRAQEAAQRTRERALRAEQDRAFEETRRRDKERVERRIAEERAQEDEKRRTEQEAERAAAELARAEAQRLAWEARRMAWRRWARRTLVLREPRPGEVGRGKTIRVGVRMPDGRRPVRFFGESDTVTALYVYVDSLFVPSHLAQDGDPERPPNGRDIGKAALVEEITSSDMGVEQWWGFKLVLAYPRREIGWEPARRLGEVDALKGGGQVVVEMLADAPGDKGKGKVEAADAEVDSDGYATEESE
ncbi:hypothetical protein B0H21DRAFT_520653 [Amylocystis lapponica]|nr:hypothetical protein B0H21DRAFT_520653 [Amylocystis lapponica]